MVPINLNKESCSPISSNCVIWQGPDVPCIHLCNGDTVTDVVAKLASELCTILDTLNVTNYDLSCFNIAACGPANFEQLIQFLIDQICAIQNGGTTVTTKTSGCPDCLVTVASCFQDEFDGNSAQLLDYVQVIGTRICSIVLQVGVLQTAVTNLDGRVTTLESYFPIPPTPEAEIVPDCVLPATPTPVSEVVTALELAFCNLIGVTGDETAIYNAIISQCVSNGDPRKDGGGAMSTIPGWFSTVNTLAESITNIWLTVCDLRALANTTIAVTDTNTINLTVTGGPAYNLQADIVDTGWQYLKGFDYYGVNPPGSAMINSRPQCRKIGNVIHFRGLVTIPLSSTADGNTLVPFLTADAYHGQAVPWTFGGISGTYGNGVSINTNGAITFNAGSTVIPTSVTSSVLDGESSLGWIVATRPINLDATYGTALSAMLNVTLTTAGLLVVSTLKDLEITSTRGSGYIGASPLRFTTSNVRVGEYVPNYLAANTDIQNAPSNANFALVSDTRNVTYPFSCDAGNESQIGGFQFKLDGLMAYLAP